MYDGKMETVRLKCTADMMKVIIDRVEGDYYIGRTEFDSPEVDPEVLIERNGEQLIIGNFYQVEIVNSDDFDLFGRVI